MVEVKFLDGTPVPDDYLTSVSLLVRDAALAIDLFGEGELEAASQRSDSHHARGAAMARKRCCVCGEVIFEESSAFDTCEDCLDDVSRDPEAFIGQALVEKECVLRAYATGKGDVDTVYPTLRSAIAAFLAAPVNSMPVVLRDGETIAELDPEAGLIPVFWDTDAQHVGRELVHRRGLGDKPAMP
ncbi:MAG TPA: hypothetical protein VD932_05335 [Aquabacterium sp.]|nr:hypothetical protein [Aquabacterium sp.]